MFISGWITLCDKNNVHLKTKGTGTTKWHLISVMAVLLGCKHVAFPSKAANPPVTSGFLRIGPVMQSVCPWHRRWVQSSLTCLIYVWWALMCSVCVQNDFLTWDESSEFHVFSTPLDFDDMIQQFRFHIQIFPMWKNSSSALDIA